METVKNAFDSIAPGWYNYRHHTIFRKELEELSQRWQKGKLLNLGCGHGADFLPFKEGFELYGVDFSGEMLKHAQKYADKYHLKVNLTQADVCRLPFPDNTFEWAIAVATYHHLKGHTEQLQALRELQRVLTPGGEAFLTVWNWLQPRFWGKSKEVMVPWRTGGRTVNRYYYLFTYGELEKLVRQAGFTIIKSFPESRYRFPVKWFSRNICLLVRKG
ncbi:MAG: methyltransferase domain-containing protein [Dehalococcoidales bacterium]|nr:methyltransferase domain-containing protein [Dehalococcoidales bacterium]